MDCRVGSDHESIAGKWIGKYSFHRKKNVNRAFILSQTILSLTNLIEKNINIDNIKRIYYEKIFYDKLTMNYL
jgi:hypothetical protein